MIQAQCGREIQFTALNLGQNFRIFALIEVPNQTFRDVAETILRRLRFCFNKLERRFKTLQWVISGLHGLACMLPFRRIRLVLQSFEKRSGRNNVGNQLLLFFRTADGVAEVPNDTFGQGDDGADARDNIDVEAKCFSHD